MNKKVKPTGSKHPLRSTRLPFRSPVSTFGFSVAVLFGVVGSSLAQHPFSTGQSTVSYGTYTTTSQPVIASHSIIRNWALDVANAQQNLDPNRLPDIGSARQKLDRAMTELENFLGTAPQHQANWLAFLTWNGLREELTREKPDQDQILQFEKTFRQNYVGLEMRQFTKVRDALHTYSNALKFSSDRPKAIEIFKNRLTKLSEQLQLPDAVQNFEGTREIGQTVAYLMQGNQAHDLVIAIRGGYSRANARVLVSSDFVNGRFSRPVQEEIPVNELILGTQLYGQSWLQGQVTPQLLDSRTHAALRLNLSGLFSSQNIGYNRSVKLHTQGSGNVAASETIALTDRGLVTLNDTSSDANLFSQINDIEAKLRIVRKIASKQAAKQKPQADAIAEGRLEERLRIQFHEKLVQQINEANQKLKDPDIPVLARLGLERPKRSTWSSPQYLAMLWRLQGPTQLGAPSSCPLVVDSTGITVQLHESVISNMIDPVLAGRVLKSSEMDTMALQFADVLGKGSKNQKEEEPWAVSMAAYHPVEIQLDDSLVTFRIRTNKLDRNGQILDQPASIEAAYKITLSSGAIQLERQGNVKIGFAGKQQQGSRAVLLRSFLKKKFEEVFKENLLDQPICITDRLPSDLQGLSLSSIQVDDGWIQAHLR